MINSKKKKEKTPVFLHLKNAVAVLVPWYSTVQWYAKGTMAGEEEKE